MSIRTEDDLTNAVLAVMARTRDPRLREIMTALVKHLHGFVREVRLTESEFRAATALINDLGQQTTDTHNEAVLMAGSLGVSALVCLINNTTATSTQTSQNMLGPFWRLHSPETRNGESIVRSPTPGPALFVELQFVDQRGAPVADAEVDIWHASPVGFYENQDATQAPMNMRGKFRSDTAGRIAFRTVKPKGYPIPTTGVVGKLLTAQNRHPYRPAHVHALAFKPGFKTLITQIYAHDDPNLETDVQFGVTEALIGRFVAHDEPHPSAQDVVAPWYSLEMTLAMTPGDAVLPKPPIK